MNFQRLLIAIILLSVVLVFILGSYLAADSSARLRRYRPGSFRWRWQDAEVWPVIQNFTWSAADLGRGDRGSKIQSGGISRLSTNLTRRMTSSAGNPADAQNQTEPLGTPYRKRHNSSKRAKVVLRDTMKRILMHMDPDLKVQYFLQADKYQSQHSKPIQELDAALQWDFLTKFMAAAGYRQRLPDVINIGVKKSGTNALGFFITQHPLISHSIGNEVHFFDWNYHKGLDFYRSRMGFSTGPQLSFEKTPRYFVTDSAPEAIAKDLGNRTKFILCVRDPISRLVSDFRHERELKLRRSGGKPFKRPTSSSPESEGELLTSLILNHKGDINASSDVVRTSSYSVHLKNWLQYYPISSFLFLDHDDLLRNTFKSMEEVERFLKLDSYFTRGMFYYDPVRGGPCMFRSERPCPAKSTPGFLPKAKLSQKVESKLKEYFRPIIADFVHLTGKEFAWSEKYIS